MTFTEEDLTASICRESFYDFLLNFWETIVADPLVQNWHLRYLCEELQKVAERVIARQPRQYDLVINVPPASTKSTIVSQMFPAWVWTRMPHAQFVCVSYAERIALKDALRCRDIVQSSLYQRIFPGIVLREDMNTKGLFKNSQGGYRLSSGMGGQVTGEHGHFLLVDDPLNPEQSYSEAELVSANRFMETTLPSRRIDKLVSPIILIQQRLHQADPTGEMLERSKPGEIRHICLPAEIVRDSTISPPELADRYQDQLLDPRRMSRAVLQRLEIEMGAYGYAAQLLQNPVPLGGGMFDVTKLVQTDDVAQKLNRVVRSWDKAGTEGGGAWSVGLKMAVDGDGKYWILDVVRGQWGATKREAMIRQTAETDGEEVEILLEIEGGSGGKESGENTIRNLAGFNVYAYHPTGDKEVRAYPFSSQVGAGNVYLLRRSWTRDLIEEMRFFPKSKYKDQIDAAAAAFARLAKKKRKVGGF